MDSHASGTRTEPRTPGRREPEGLWEWNLAANRIHFSPDWLALAGCQDHEISHSPEDWFVRVHQDDRPSLLRDLDALRNGGASEFTLHYRLRHSDGRHRWMRSTGRIIRNDRDEVVRLTGSQSDVTIETVTDDVTGLPNRLLLIEHLAQSIAQAQRQPVYRFGLLLIDLGRPPGPMLRTRSSPEPLLNHAARRIEACVRSPGGLPGRRRSDLVARLDGDRFAVLLDGIDDFGHATAVAEHILHELLESIQAGGREIRLSPAIGMTLSATGYAQPEEPLRDAEAALHRARVLGDSHCELFDAHVLRSEQAEAELERALEVALQRDEFILHYQPVVSISSNRVVGFEALVRWQHPQLGLVPPLDFVPLAERTGLIVPLGEWILEQACRQVRAWESCLAGPSDFWVSVNVSAVQLRNAPLVERIEATLLRTGVDGRRLAIELTEGVAMDNPVAVTTALMRLRALGVRISLDDFGTGYSSLAYLRQLPVDTLKIDRSFVRRLGADQNTTAIVSGILSMARELGLSAIVEGVEDASQLETLRALGCEAVQGYFYAEPLDANAAWEYLLTGPISTPGAPANRGSSPETTGGWDAPAGAGAPQPWLAEWISWLGHRAAATIAVLGVLLLAGVSAVFYGISRTAAVDLPGISEPATWHRTDDSIHTGVPAGRALLMAAADRDSTRRRPDAPAATAAEVSTATTAAPRSTFPVLHLHRLGACDGQLIVSEKGIEFTAGERGDAFLLPHGDFVQRVEGTTLVIRTAKKVYRFTSRNDASNRGGDTPMDRIADSIVRARPR